MFLELFLFAKKMKFSYNFQAFPWHFYSMRGHSLVELTEHGDSAVDIIVHSMFIDVPLHSLYIMCTDNEWTPPLNSRGIP